MRRPRSTHLLIAAVCLAWSVPAHAGFKACNETEGTIGLSFAHSTGKEWISKGWWTIPAKACITVVNGALTSRFYYLRAVDFAGGGWGGNRSFCATAIDPTLAKQRDFTITGRDKCEERGYAKAGFFEVDTQDAAEYTHYFSDKAP